MYRIRFHGRGGQGMKTASRILGRAFFLEGFDIQDAPRYGAERRGAPIFAYVRASKKTINERGIVTSPDLVIVADDSLVAVPAAGVLKGLTDKTILLIYSTADSQTWKERLNYKGSIITLTPPKKERPTDVRFVGSACVGAGAALLGVIKEETLGDAIKEELAELGSSVVEKNMERAKQAFQLMKERSGVVAEGKELSITDYEKPSWIDVPFEGASLSAPVIHGVATSEYSQTGLWRTMRPILDSDVCKHCWWLCSTFCPESAIEVMEDGLPKIDYDHCKGCLICMAQCPHHVISAKPEREFKEQDKKGPE